MQRAMDRLSGFVRRRRRLVLAAWALLLLASVPFASRQTENLTGGGFDVPGSSRRTSRRPRPRASRRS